MRLRLILPALALLALAIGCQRAQPRQGRAPRPLLTSRQRKIVDAARALMHRHLVYRDAYYAGGDPPPDEGVCTDLVVRSLRAVGLDLRALMNSDIKAAPQAYPLSRWRQTAPDRDIDHRRCPNQVAFFARRGLRLTTRVAPGRPEIMSQWQGGDIVFWDLADSGVVDHVGIVSDRRNRRGIPLVIHHLPGEGGVCEDDSLTAWTIVAHFRYPKPSPAN
jgi:hypothetical protein